MPKLGGSTLHVTLPYIGEWSRSGELTLEEFIAGCLKGRGPAKAKDILAARVTVLVQQHQPEDEPDSAAAASKHRIPKYLMVLGMPN